MNQHNNKKTTLRLTQGNRLLPRDIAESLGKLPPQAIELEEAVLGAMMLEKNSLTAVIEFLKPDHFYTEAHKEIYNAVVNLFKIGEPIDMRTVVDQLRKDGKIELVGGAYYIAELTSKVSSSANIEYHARVIVEMGMKRDLIMIASGIHQDAFDDTSDVFELMERAQSSIDKITHQSIRGAVMPGRVVYEKAMTRLADKNESGINGVPSGYIALDKLTGGWQNSDLVIIAARPSMGKTAFVVNCMRNAAIDFKKPVAIFSLEMAAIQLMNRMISAESEVVLDRVIKKNYTDEDYDKIVNKSKRLYSAPIFIDDTPGLSILELRAKCRRLKAEHNVELIIVDYLQLMKGDPDSNNREQEIASISRALKGIAKELEVPVLGLSQLSRATESRAGDKKPMLGDLRESGAIEQDADIVIFLYRAEYYKISTYEDGSPTQGVLEAIVAKHRNGSLETVKLKFIGKYSKVTGFDEPVLSTFGTPMRKIETPFNTDYVRDVSTTEVDKPDDDLPF